jgi:osmotically-inducible protein OsmY
MKTAKKLSVISSLLLAAGCSHHDNTGRYSESHYSAPYPSSSITYTATSPTGSSSTTGTFGQGDQALVTQVKLRLGTDVSLAEIAPKVQVSAQNGTVTLSGTVSSDLEKQQIETVAKGTSGVINVNNQLQVAPQPTSAGSDRTSRLYHESKTDASKSAVPSAEQAKSETAAVDRSRTDSATQTESQQALTGVSTNQATSPLPTLNQDLTPTSQRPDAGNRIYSTTNQTAAAATPTGQTTEAFSVNVQGATEADRSLGQKVIQELRADTSLAATIPTIKVNVDGNKVTITGTVKNEDEKAKIESAVQRVTGVVNVENQLQVSTNPAATESK